MKRFLPRLLLLLALGGRPHPLGQVQEIMRRQDNMAVRIGRQARIDRAKAFLMHKGQIVMQAAALAAQDLQQAEIVRHAFLLRQGEPVAGAPPLATYRKILPFKMA